MSPHVTALAAKGSWNEIGALLDFDFYDELEDDADFLVGTSMPAMVIHGDLRIEGDISTEALPQGLPGFQEPEESKHYAVVVLGNLEVTGHLTIHQYNDLLVRGDVKARSIRSCSANMVVKGTATATELVLFEESDEGGLPYARSLETPLVVRLGGANDVEPPVSGKVLTSNSDREALVLVAEKMSGQAMNTDLDLYKTLATCITQGQGKALVEAL